MCSRPPALDDLALITAIDGEASAEILAHLRLCQHCAHRAHELTTLHRLLSKRLYRVLCPSSDELLAFRQGWLDHLRAATIRDHLEVCPHCVADLRLLAEAADVPAATRPAQLSRLRRVVAELLRPAPQAPLAAAYGALRGGALGGQYAYRADNLQIMLDVERAAGRPGRYVLLGLLLLEDGAVAPHSASASLLCDDMVINSTMLDELGNFVIDDIAPGDYSLSLRLPDREVIVEALSL